MFLSKSGAIQVEDAPAPGCGPGEVLIDVAYSVISTGTETSSMAGGDLRSRLDKSLELARLGVERLRTRGLAEVLRKAKVREGISAPMGYSVAGVVREVGADVVDLRAGDRVAAGGAAYAHHAEVVAVPRNLVVPVPDGADLRAASFATVGAIAMQGVRQAAPQVGESAVVIGLGLVGQLTVQILAAAGCRVIGADPREDRVALAREGPGGLVAGVGADASAIEKTVAAATGGHGADVVLLCAGTASSEPMQTAMKVVRQRGRVVVVGAVGMELAREPFYRKEATLTISCSYGPGRYDPSYEEGGLDYPYGFVRWTENRNMEAFLDLVARGRVDPAHLVAAEHPLEEAPAAFAAAKAGADARVALVLRYPEPAPA
ncbi:MAG: oxidoreductase, partial [Proteobacteria bacterium]